MAKWIIGDLWRIYLNEELWHRKADGILLKDYKNYKGSQRRWVDLEWIMMQKDQDAHKIHWDIAKNWTTRVFSSMISSLCLHNAFCTQVVLAYHVNAAFCSDHLQLNLTLNIPVSCWRLVPRAWLGRNKLPRPFVKSTAPLGVRPSDARLSVRPSGSPLSVRPSDAPLSVSKAKWCPPLYSLYILRTYMWSSSALVYISSESFMCSPSCGIRSIDSLHLLYSNLTSREERGKLWRH